MGSHNNSQRAPNINTGYPGHVFNFDAATQTCEVQLAIESLFITMTSPYELHTKDRLKKVPVQFTQGGGWAVTHPVPDGTPCYVHFAQRGITHWLSEDKSEAGFVNGKPAPAFSQLFSHNSAVCIVGNQPIPRAISSFQSDLFELRNADRGQRVSLHGDGKIEIMTGAAKIVITKDSKIEIEVTSEAVVKAPKITLDGDTTVTKSLTVMGGMAVSGTVGGNTMSITGTTNYSGNITQTGSYTINGVAVNGHTHTNPEGGNVGSMK